VYGVVAISWKQTAHKGISVTALSRRPSANRLSVGPSAFK